MILLRAVLSSRTGPPSFILLVTYSNSDTAECPADAQKARPRNKDGPLAQFKDRYGDRVPIRITANGWLSPTLITE